MELQKFLRIYFELFGRRLKYEVSGRLPLEVLDEGLIIMVEEMDILEKYLFIWKRKSWLELEIFLIS